MRPVAGAASLVAQVSEALLEAVVSGELIPGDLYSVSQLAEQLNVSRTPVREALLGLADAGLVRVERNRGFRVVRQDADRLGEVFQMRLLLEVPATRWAAGRVDTRLLDTLREAMTAMVSAAAAGDASLFMKHDRAFHAAVLLAGGNRMLAATVAGLRDIIATVGASTVPRSRTLRDIAEEHRPIFNALTARDPEAAGEAMRSHLTHTRDLLLGHVTAT